MVHNGKIMMAALCFGNLMINVIMIMSTHGPNIDPHLFAKV